MDFSNHESAPGAASRQSPLLDNERVARYASELDGLAISDDQKRELIQSVWAIMYSFVELGFAPPDVWGYLSGESETLSRADSGAVESAEDCAISQSGKDRDDR